MNTESGILRTSHFSVLVTFSEFVSRWSVLKLGSARQQLCSVLLILQCCASISVGHCEGNYLKMMRADLENDIIDSLLVQDRQLVQTLRLWRIDLICQLCRALQPLNSIFRSFRQTQLSIDFCQTEAMHRTGMRENSSASMREVSDQSDPF